MKMFGKKGIFGLFIAVLLVMMWCGEAMAGDKQTSAFVEGLKKQDEIFSKVGQDKPVAVPLKPGTNGQYTIGDAFNEGQKTTQDGLAKMFKTSPVKDDAKNDASAPKGSATSGNVKEYVGAKSLSNNFSVNCSGGNIFDQLGCRAGAIGRGLQSVGYIIAGFGLLAFSLAALFGKVKWNVFVTIMFSCFVLSMMVFVINTFTSEGNSAWIAGIQKTGQGNNASVPGDTDKVPVKKSQ